MNSPSSKSDEQTSQFKQFDSQSVVDNLPVCLLCKNIKGRAVFANRMYLEFHEISLEELLASGEPLPNDRSLCARLATEDAEVIESGEVIRNVIDQQVADETRRIEYLKAPHRNDKGDIIGIQVLSWIANDKAAGDDVAFSESALLRSLLTSAPDGIYFKDKESRFITASESVVRFFGLNSTSELIGKRDSDFFTSEHADEARRDEVEIMETGRPIIGRIEKETWPDRPATWCSSSKLPLRDDAGNIVGTFGISRDITDVIDFETKLQLERDRLQTLMDHLPDVILIKDRAGRFLMSNPALNKLYGCESSDELVGKTDFDFVPEEVAQSFADDDQAVMRSGQPLLDREEVNVGPDGERVWMLTSKIPLRDPAGNVTGLVGIGRDITKLKNALEAADAANKAKGDFLANVSHEIRTPLNGVIGMTELLLDTNVTETQREYLEMVQTSGESLLNLINDILDFSKIESGKMDLDSITFDLRESMGDTMKLLGTRAHKQGLELAFSMDNNVPAFLVGDPARLRQIVVNLVGNAIKFTEQGEVVLRLSAVARKSRKVRLRFEISDTGIGIPADKIDAVFDAFQQADSSTTRSYGGTGLGLAISTRLVEMMNGKIWCESEVGKGSVFTFEAEFEIARHVPDSRRNFVAIRGMRTLIVDDNATNRRILMETCSRRGLDPIAASSADHAIEILQDCLTTKPVALLLSDVHMPGRDGFDLCEHVRSDERFADLKIVMLTSGSNSGDLERRQKLDVQGHLLKPVKQSELFECIETVMATDSSPQSVSTAADAEQQPAITGLRVLLVEDNLVNQKLAVALLEKQNHVVTLAGNGLEAVEAYRNGKFDVVLMDVQMPEMDGLEATAAIRKFETESGRRTPIIAMTAHAMKGDRERFLDAGMDQYLSKPIRGKEIAEMFAQMQLKSSSEPQSPAGDAGSQDPGANENSLIDWELALETAEGDRELLRVLIDAFLQESPGLIAQARSAIEASDVQSLHNAAHSLKGSMMSVGATQTSQLASAIEVLSAADKLADAAAKMKQLAIDTEKVQNELAAFDPEEAS